ncbi:hypothetical protein A2274_02395 [candidate division WWE3 bacterium RIFOXYA12_FULL_43_11]|nr:MAG: hypothetical protein A2274_02395 [candidate division WWE3 bacterium RIFOXYA12_FULL_43_11]
MSTLTIKTPLRFSRFLHVLDFGNGVSAFYNALNQAVVYTASDFSSALQALQKPFSTAGLCGGLGQTERKTVRNLIRQLWRHKMLLEPDEDEMLDVETLRQFLNKPEIAILYLLLTDACNIACRYCYFEGGIPEGYKFSLMTFETAKSSVDLFVKVHARDLLKSNKEGPHIIFYGGEALLNWPVAKATLEYISKLKKVGQLPKNTRVTLNTNGILLNQEIAKVLIKHRVNIAVSLDGPWPIHDLMRVGHDGKGTFDLVMPKLKMLRDMGAHVGTCCTIDSHNIDQIEDVTKWMIEDLGFDTIGFNTLLESTERPIPNPEYYGEKVGQKLVNCFQIAREHGVYEDRFMRKVKAFIKGDFYFADCGGCGMQIVATPEGDIGPCQGYCGTRKYFVKPDSNFDPRTHSTWKEWRTRSPINMEPCLDCIALANCGGGCPHNSDVKDGSIWEVDSVFCKQSIYSVKFLIRDLFEQHQLESI